jgi:hypothetical protein
MHVNRLMLAVVAAACAARADAATAHDDRFVAAVKAGNRSAVRVLMKEPGVVNRAEPDGTTPLHWAVRGDDRDMVELLLMAAPTRQPPTGMACSR